MYYELLEEILDQQKLKKDELILELQKLKHDAELKKTTVEHDKSGLERLVASAIWTKIDKLIERVHTWEYEQVARMLPPKGILDSSDQELLVRYVADNKRKEINDSYAYKLTEYWSSLADGLAKNTLGWLLKKAGMGDDWTIG